MCTDCKVFFNLATIILAARLNTDMHKHVLNVIELFFAGQLQHLWMSCVLGVLETMSWKRVCKNISESYLFSLTCHIFSGPVWENWPPAIKLRAECLRACLPQTVFSRTFCRQLSFFFLKLEQKNCCCFLYVYILGVQLKCSFCPYLGVLVLSPQFFLLCKWGIAY